MSLNRPTVSPAEVITFWLDAGPKRWFEKDAAFDAEIRQRFAATYEAAAAGALADWQITAESCLALLIVLDQFPRNMFRDSAASLRDRPIARSASPSRRSRAASTRRRRCPGGNSSTFR